MSFSIVYEQFMNNYFFVDKCIFICKSKYCVFLVLFVL